MSIREMLEAREHQIFSPYAAFADQSKGRERDEEQCDMRTCFQRDRDRIIHSKSFRRLKGKTQVFLAPEGDHYRTRLTHTLEVSQISRSIARALFLNEDLTEAIALGHDLGHTPFGHCGERVLNQLCSEGFNHAAQSVRVVQKLDNQGNGLNLTYEVIDGIVNHQTVGRAKTLEGRIVRVSDKIAYVNHDVDDAIRGLILKEEDIPERFRSTLGRSFKERIDRMIHDVIHQSAGKDDIYMSSEIEEAMKDLRQYMFDHIYTNPVAKGEEGKAAKIVEYLFHEYMDHPDMMSRRYQKMTDDGEPLERVVCDYVSGMTDNFAIMKFRQLTIPDSWDIY